ncbi:Non-heme chloroperoxidase [Tritonibacter multivorans]|uniref:Non-heme chloroperoxidase n=1 Tax=Tritonibacter multivorans TaxID=928856 RepID=A0A0P1GB05_9RHOB|nr:alpha/beta hydrolase [Tritonibacter multivorans]MDA7422047.1 alpha/beta hydrolase [Tritonibacter multivorans]CUH78573.1 Non-heme chloroperoxidase [Tritonibacter multivorans]SFD18662.1 Pimeloyl-ACP methyl ester carboxylesterase [Tritonibacter multivorans]
MPRVVVNDVSLNVTLLDQQGDAPRQDLVFCHGLASSMGFWPIELLTALRTHFRIVMFDQRGHGRSQVSASGYSPKDLGGDLLALITALDLQRPHLVAHSFGGVAALAMLADHPEAANSLILLDSQIGMGRDAAAATDPSAKDAELISALADIGVTFDPADPFAGLHLITGLAQRRLSGQSMESEDARVQFLVRSVQSAKAKRWMSLVQETSAITEMTSPDGLSPARLAEIGIPVLSLCGGYSAAQQSGKLLSTILPRCKTDVISDAGHFFVATRSEDVAARCLAFYQQLGFASPEVMAC